MRNNSRDQKNITESTKPPAGIHKNVLQGKKPTKLILICLNFNTANCLMKTTRNTADRHPQ